MQIKTFVWPLLSALARFRWARPTALVLRFLTNRLQMPRDGADANRSGTAYRALVLNANKSGVLQDIEETFRDVASFQVLGWPSYALRPLAAALLSPKLDHNYYLSEDPEIEASKQTYRRFLREVWKHYCRASRVDVVLAGNFAYFHQREFGAALEELGTPFIAIHKENVRPPKRVMEYWSRIYKERRGPFAGRKILVYNDIERDLEITSDVFDASGIEVTGMPRLDKLHRWRRENAGAACQSRPPHILFFAFSRQDKLTAPARKASGKTPKGSYEMDGDWGQMGWDNMWRETHEAIVGIARDNPDIKVVIKLKGQLDKASELRSVLGVDDNTLPENVELVAGGNPFNLIALSDVVVGFNTTALLEAIAAGKPVIVPRFQEANNRERQGLIIDLAKAVEHASSSNDLVERAVRHARTRSGVPDMLSPGAIKALEHWVGNADGAAGKRVLAAIQKEVG